MKKTQDTHTVAVGRREWNLASREKLVMRTGGVTVTLGQLFSIALKEFLAQPQERRRQAAEEFLQ